MHRVMDACRRLLSTKEAQEYRLERLQLFACLANLPSASITRCTHSCDFYHFFNKLSEVSVPPMCYRCTDDMYQPIRALLFLWYVIMLIGLTSLNKHVIEPIRSKINMSNVHAFPCLCVLLLQVLNKIK